MTSISYFTNRNEPKSEWWIDSIARQVKENSVNPKDLDVIILDYYGREEKFIQEKESAEKKFGKFCQYFRVIKPKPNIWQGEFKKVKQRNYFAAANARNTAFISAKGDYVICCDDISVPMPGWLTNALHASKTGYIVQGAYRKVYKLVVKDGVVESFEDHPSGHDPRWRRGSSGGIVPSAGHLLFGCSFGVPMEYILRTNGLDEDCDPIGGEDYLFGIRLARLGVKFWYNRNMLTYESEELHHDKINEIFLRIDKATPGHPGGHDSSHIILSRVGATSSPKAIGNLYNMEQAREAYQKTGEFPPINQTEVHWVDNQRLEEM